MVKPITSVELRARNEGSSISVTLTVGEESRKVKLLAKVELYFGNEDVFEVMES